MVHGSPFVEDPRALLGRAIRRTVATPLLGMTLVAAALVTQLIRLRSAQSEAECAAVAALAVLVGGGLALQGRRELTSLSKMYSSTLEKLGRQRDDAERADRLKDEFLATASHELHASLNAILGWTMLLRRCPEDLHMVGRAAETIDRNARAQVRMVDEIVDASKVVTGKLMLDMDAIRVEATVDAALAAVRTTAQAKSVEVTCSVEDGANVFGDALRLRQIVGTLVGQAVRAAPSHGRVTVSARTEAGDHVELRVSDTGTRMSIAPPGKDPTSRPAGPPSPARTSESARLGLAIVRHLVEMHGGTLRIEHPRGGGSTAIVQLPVPPLSVSASFPVAPTVTSPRALDGDVPDPRSFAT